MMIAKSLLCVTFWFIGGCATDGRKERALRDNPGCVWDESDDSLICPLPWESTEEIRNLKPEEIEEMIKPKPKAKKKKK
jgi:hypothetical protein